jgi:hypothetical protein
MASSGVLRVAIDQAFRPDRVDAGPSGGHASRGLDKLPAWSQIRSIMRAVVLAGLITALASASAHADRVHLVGGNVIEGRATRQGDRVTIELGSGVISVAASDVARIESTDSEIQQFERRAARLAAGDIRGTLELAQFCRDHDMRDRERELLQRVLKLDPDHAEARARLGYVRPESGGWILRDDQMRAQGMVQQDGQWMTPAQRLEIEQARAQTERARHERDQAKAELEAKRVELQRERAASAEESEPPAPASSDPLPAMYYGYYGYGYPYGSAAYVGSRGAHDGAGRDHHGSSRRKDAPSAGSAPVDPRTLPSPIVGVKSPFQYFR